MIISLFINNAVIITWFSSFDWYVSLFFGVLFIARKTYNSNSTNKRKLAFYELIKNEVNEDDDDEIRYLINNSMLDAILFFSNSFLFHLFVYFYYHSQWKRIF